MHHKTLQQERGNISASSFSELAEIAISHIEEIGCSDVVCGPITNGGFRDLEKNLNAFAATIMALRSLRRNVFNQLAYEGELWRLQDEWGKNGGTGLNPILTEFYEPIFRSGKLRRAHFMHGWESSVGARWERSLLTELDFEIRDIPRIVVIRYMENADWRAGRVPTTATA